MYQSSVSKLAGTQSIFAWLLSFRVYRFAIATRNSGGIAHTDKPQNGKLKTVCIDCMAWVFPVVHHTAQHCFAIDELIFQADNLLLLPMTPLRRDWPPFFLALANSLSLLWADIESKIYEPIEVARSERSDPNGHWELISDHTSLCNIESVIRSVAHCWPNSLSGLRRPNKWSRSHLFYLYTWLTLKRNEQQKDENPVETEFISTLPAHID